MGMNLEGAWKGANVKCVDVTEDLAVGAVEGQKRRELKNVFLPRFVWLKVILMMAVAWPAQRVGGEAEVGVSEKWVRHTIDDSSLGADGVRTADLNGDGLPDLVVGWEQGGVSRIYLMRREVVGVPDWEMVEVGAAPSVEDALLVDLDRDGAIDVVSSTEGNSRKVLVHWAPNEAENYGSGAAWKTETLLADGSRWMFAVAMDIDGRNGPDLVVGGKGPGASVGWLESPTDPRRLEDWRFHRWTEVTWVMSIIPTDVDGDGLVDVVVSDRKGEMEGVFWLRNPGAGAVALRQPWIKAWIADDLHESNFIDVRDIDGDGVDEVLVPHLQGGDEGVATVLDRDAAGVWQRSSIVLPGVGTKPKAVRAADVNLDGALDLVVSFEKAQDPSSSGVIWLEQRSEASGVRWILHDVSGAEGIKFDLNLLLDVDGDGDLDVVNTEENNNAQNGDGGLGLIWYENPVR